MKRNSLSMESKKRISAGALLDIVAAALPEPLGVTIPFIGNVLLAINDKSRDRQEMDCIKKKIDKLQQSQQEEIKEALLRLDVWEAVIQEQEQRGKKNEMIYSVDAVEILFRGMLDPDWIMEMQELISDFISEGVEFEDGSLNSNSLNCPVDDAYTSQEGVILNFSVPISREDLNLVLERVDMLVQSIDIGNQVKSVILY